MAVNPNEAVVIIIEDNPDNLFIVEDMLRSEVRVKYCNGRASGRQFFKWFETHQVKPDLILLDLQIPHEDGYKVLQRIRADQVLGQTRVVALTANVMPDDVERAHLSGFDGFIGKPISRKRFPQQITRILAGEQIWEP